MRISDWSSDVCSSDLDGATGGSVGIAGWAYITNKTLEALKPQAKRYEVHDLHCPGMSVRVSAQGQKVFSVKFRYGLDQKRMKLGVFPRLHAGLPVPALPVRQLLRSDDHTSDLQSLMRISYAVFCLKNIIKPVIHT